MVIIIIIIIIIMIINLIMALMWIYIHRCPTTRKSSQVVHVVVLSYPDLIFHA